MRKNVLLLLTALAAWCVSGQRMWASNTTDYLTQAGWEKVESTLPTDLEEYYFVLCDPNEDIVLALGDATPSQQASGKSMYYRTTTHIESSLAIVWMLESRTRKATDGTTEETVYAFRNVTYPQYLLQTASDAPWVLRTESAEEPNELTDFKFINEDGHWIIQNGAVEGDYYLGPWVTRTYADGQELAANKSAASYHYGWFSIYRMKKSSFERKRATYAQTQITNIQAAYTQMVAPEEAVTALGMAISKAEAVASTDLESSHSALSDLQTAFADYLPQVTGLKENAAPVDLTFCARNMDFVDDIFNSTAPWQHEIATGNFRLMTPDVATLNWDGTFLESYVNTGDVAGGAGQRLAYQTVTGMPHGNYRFTARTFCRDAWFKDGRTPNGIDLYLNKRTYRLTTQTLETLGSVEGYCAEGTLEFGIRAGSDFNTDWNGLGDAHLYYLGAPTDLTPFQTALEEAEAQAQQLAKTYTGLLPTAYLTALNTPTDVTNFTSADEYTTATEAVNQRIAYAEQLKDAYAIYLDWAQYAQQMNNVLTASEEDKSTFSTVMKEQATAANNALTTEAVNEAVSNLKTACITYDGTATITSGTFDVTRLYLTNPDLTGTAANIRNYAGWYTDLEGWNFQTMINDEVKSTDDGKNAFMEFFKGDGYQGGYIDANGWAIYQKANLPAGAYQMKAYAFGKGSFNGYTADFTGAMYAGETRGTDLTGASAMTPASVTFISQGGEIKLGLKAEEGNRANWAGVGYMQLFKVAKQNLELDESQTFTLTEDTPADVSLTRTLSAEKWNTLCLPFDLTAEQVTATFADVRELTGAERTDDSYNLTFEQPQGNTMKAGKPYLVKALSATGTLAFQNVMVQAKEPEQTAVGNVIMQGNYSPLRLENNEYFIKDNMFYYATSTNYANVKGYRAYIVVNAPEESLAKIMYINLEGTTTAIEEVNAGEDATVSVYTLSGIRLKHHVRSSEALNGLPKGVYIVNGRKVIK